MNAFFIVGVQRSGTTLLSVLLSNHPEVLMEKQSVAFRMISCFKSLYDILPYNVQHNQQELLNWLIKNDHQGRLASLIGNENIKDHQSIKALINQAIVKKLKPNNKQIWGDKSPNLQHYQAELLQLIPDAKIIHIVRDGRANAYSTAKRSYRDLCLSAQQWVDGNNCGLVNQLHIGPEQYKIIQYENLLTQPEKELKSICVFLGIPFSIKMLDLSSKELRQEKSYVKAYFDKEKINKWKTQLTHKQIKKVEAIQGPLLTRFDYDLLHPPLHQPLSVSRAIFLNQKDNFKQLFNSKRIGMKNQEKVILHLSLKARIASFIRTLCKDFLPFPVFKSLFNKAYFGELYFKKDTSKNN